ncbi:prepilin-type N-terminal cleavage/methylation domain-containing protein [Hydrogenophaga sp. PAMC20947]|nr:prepilin-type N-terminal cleavage/methylation domain-containing protein [Hydrogenophaga sp. PAMC20947]
MKPSIRQSSRDRGARHGRVWRDRRGFTLIEMLVVMTLIAMLLTLAVPRYFGSLEKSRIRVQQQNVATLRDAIDKYKADLGRYPDNLQDLVVKSYLRQIPLDPVTEAADWVVIAPADPQTGNVYDIQPAPVAQQPAAEER